MPFHDSSRDDTYNRNCGPDYTFVASTEQAFYYAADGVFINGVKIGAHADPGGAGSGDAICAFMFRDGEEICIGARYLDYLTSNYNEEIPAEELPVMGANDGFGMPGLYPGEYPTFKAYVESENRYYDIYPTSSTLDNIPDIAAWLNFGWNNIPAFSNEFQPYTGINPDFPQCSGIIDETDRQRDFGPNINYCYAGTTIQGFYFFNKANILVNDSPAEDDDVIGAFTVKDGIETCVGANRVGKSADTHVDVPVYGADHVIAGSELYAQTGDTIYFKVYKIRENRYYDVFPSENFTWSPYALHTIDSLSTAIEVNIPLYSGANLIGIPLHSLDGALLEDIFPPDEYAGIIQGVIRQQGACNLLPGSGWTGSDCTFDIARGYWFLLNEDTEITLTGNPISNIDYSSPPGGLMQGYIDNNGLALISYTGGDGLSLNDGIPSQFHNMITGIIKEQGGVLRIDNQWVGNFDTLYRDDGYWFFFNQIPDEFYFNSEPNPVTYSASMPILNTNLIIPKLDSNTMMYINPSNNKPEWGISKVFDFMKKQAQRVKSSMSQNNKGNMSQQLNNMFKQDTKPKFGGRSQRKK